MDKKSINQNESIQGGLERFLDEELLDLSVSEVKRESNGAREKSYEENRHEERDYFAKKKDLDEEEFKKDGLEEDYDLEEEDFKEDDLEEDYDLEEENGFEETYKNTSRHRDHVRSKNESNRTKPSENRKAKSDESSKRSSDKSPRKHSESISNAKRNKKAKKGRKGKKSEKKKMSKAKKVIIILLIAFCAALLWWYFMVGSAYKKMNHDKSENAALGPMKEEGVINVLLIGNDSRQNGDDGRSDAMILVSISNKTKTIHMTSLLRDMYVEIPGHDSNRLNAAYAYGGAALLCETIEKNLGIEVNRYAIVNFQAFAGLVDSVGGIDLEVTNEEVQWINAYLNEYNLLEGREMTTDYLDTSLSGTIHLNGPQALAYSRNRYIGTDFGRTERQRKVLNAVVKKLPMTMATNSSKLTDELFPNLTTNLTRLECYQLSLDASKLLSYDVIQSVVPAEGTYSNATIRKMAVLEVDFDANRKLLRKEIYGEE